MVWEPAKNDWSSFAGPFLRKDSVLVRVVPRLTAAKKESLPAHLAHIWSSSMHLRSRQHCHGDVEIVGKVGNCLEKFILNFDQSFMNGHLQVTVENSDDFFEIEANVLIGEV